MSNCKTFTIIVCLKGLNLKHLYLIWHRLCQNQLALQSPYDWFYMHL